jgi:type VI secretion system protein ImpA
MTSKTPKKKRPTAASTTPPGMPASGQALRPEFADLLAPVSAAMPCGENLEYDPEFILLFAKAEPKGEAQYGSFVAEAQATNWAEIERECRRLLLRTKDIRIAMLFLRCRVNLEQAVGLRDGLALLAQILNLYPEDIYPLPQADGETDPTWRANALAELLDPEGIRGEIRNIVLSDTRGLRLQVRDVERAFSTPRPADALAPDSVRSQLDELWHRGCPQRVAIGAASALLQEIQSWSQARLLDHAPDLTPLRKLLDWFRGPAFSAGAQRPAALPQAEGQGADAAHAGTGEPDADSQPASGAPVPGAPRPALDRYGAREHIGIARRWFEQHEPSSPVSLLLWRAEQMVGLPFHELVKSLPGDIVDAWARQMSGE